MTSELLDKSTELFAERGYESTTLADIANALGISRPALYHYVNNKDDLLTMLVQQVSQGFAEVLAELAERRDLSPTDKLMNVVSITVRQRAEHPDQFRILDRSEMALPEPLRDQHLAAKRKVLQEVMDLIQAGIEAGEFRSVEPRTTALSVLGMCNWVAWWFSRSMSVDAVVATVSDLVLAMLALPESGPGRTRVSNIVADIRVLLDHLDT